MTDTICAPSRRLAAGALAALALLSPAACKKDSTGPAQQYVGAWAGTTSSGNPIRLLVESDGIVLATVKWRVTVGSCVQGIESIFPPTTHYAVSKDGEFTITRNTSSNSVALDGTFDSNTQASGTLLVTSGTCAGGVISETWTATKATAPSVNLAGTWDGSFASSLQSTTPGTFVISQSGSSLTGTYSSQAGGGGTVSATLNDRLLTFSLNQTTSGCTGNFSGHGVALATTASSDFLILYYTGKDCLGDHNNGSATASKRP